MRCLLVEDDEMLGSAVQTQLVRAGFAADWVRNGKDFTEAINVHRYDFVVLDLGLPDTTGEVLLARLNQAQTKVRVIVVTARGSIHDRVTLLNMGADDFLVKPFDLDELTARMRSLLRRMPTDDADAGAAADEQADPASKSIATKRTAAPAATRTHPTVRGNSATPGRAPRWHRFLPGMYR